MWVVSTVLGDGAFFIVGRPMLEVRWDNGTERMGHAKLGCTLEIWLTKDRDDKGEMGDGLID